MATLELSRHPDAAAILERPLCVYCIAIKTSALAQEVLDAIPTIRTVLGVQIDSLAQCQACGSRKAVTYSLSRSQAH